MGLFSYWYRVEQRKEAEAYSLFECDFCALSFRTKCDRKSHTAVHFEKRFCLDCSTPLVRIGDEWYEQHVATNCSRKHVDTNAFPMQDIKIEEEVSLPADGDSFEPLPPNQDFFCLIEQKPECELLQCNSPAPHNTVLSNNDEYKLNEKIKLEKEIETLMAEAKRQKNDRPIQNSKVKGKTRRKADRLKQEAKLPLNRMRDFLRPTGMLTCDICKKLFLNVSSMKGHMSTVHFPKKHRRLFACDQCPRTYTTSGSLKTHQFSHTGTRNHTCIYCGKGFYQFSNLKAHLTSHTKEKRYQCEQCEKKFAVTSQLKVHMRVHTGEKPYECKIDGCNRTYAHGIDLKRHKYSAHGIYTKKHICHICLKVYPENKLLKKHLGSHQSGVV